ncbi:MAG: tetratricopeptide repeat protein [Bacteroidetes bacterium]|nr:tetratricopeptide repeat protein [Bacteroidota bacterium]
MKKISLLIIALFTITFGYSQVGDIGKIMFERASYLYKAQKYDSALIFINKAVKTSPETEEYLFKRALIKEKTNDKKGAIKDYKQCIEINPKAIYYNNLGVIYAIDSKYEEAIEWYNKALEKDSSYAQSWVNIGVAFYYLHKFDKACEAMHNASKYGLKMADSFIASNCN